MLGCRYGPSAVCGFAACYGRLPLRSAVDIGLARVAACYWPRSHERTINSNGEGEACVCAWHERALHFRLCSDYFVTGIIVTAHDNKWSVGIWGTTSRYNIIRVVGHLRGTISIARIILENKDGIGDVG